MLNNTTLVGRITKDPEISNKNNLSMCKFTLAVNRNFKNKQGEYEADFINCVAFSKTAEFIDDYVSKGQLLAVQGRIQTRNYEDENGKRIYITEVIASNVTSLESKKEVTQNYNQEQIIDDYDDDLPF